MVQFMHKKINKIIFIINKYNSIKKESEGDYTLFAIYDFNIVECISINSSGKQFLCGLKRDNIVLSKHQFQYIIIDPMIYPNNIETGLLLKKVLE